MKAAEACSYVSLYISRVLQDGLNVHLTGGFIDPSLDEAVTKVSTERENIPDG